PARVPQPHHRWRSRREAHRRHSPGRRAERGRAAPGARGEGQRRARRSRVRHRPRRHRAADGRPRSLQGDRPRAAAGEDHHRHQGALAMTQHRGYTSALRWFRAKPTNVEQPTTDSTGLSSAAHERLSEAREIAARSDSAENALAAYREAVALAKFDASVVLEYARFLIKNSRGTSAEDVLALSLARNGAQVDALELYLELVRELDLPMDRTSWALGRLEADIEKSPTEHRGALDYAIPHRLQSALQTIGTGSDPVNRAVLHIDAAYQDGSFTEATLAEARESMGANDVMRAHLTAVLARGNRTTATALLKEADPRAVPMNALRRAIRRARTVGKTKQVVDYVEAYRKLLPDDYWAKRLQVQYQSEAVSNYQLGKTGFPFPKMRHAPAYNAQGDRVFYLLHNSLPHNSAGYATRTHGLLSELNRSGWDVDGITRLRYPYDMP